MHKRMNILFYMQHSDSPPPRFLVAFAGDGGHLTSAMVGDNIVDIWAPPKDSQEVVLKPKSNIVLDDESIIRYIDLITAIIMAQMIYMFCTIV